MDRKDITKQVVETSDEGALSSDLTQITTEIKSYQAVAGQSIFEIGRRLKWVKEHDLAHGKFMDWYQNMGMSKNFVSQAMTTYEKLYGSNFPTSGNLGVEALYQIATLPEEEREKLHKLESGVVKKPDDMTVRELRELKRQLKDEREQHLAEQEELKTKYETRMQRVKADGIREVEIPVDRVPDDYEDLKKERKINLAKIKSYEELMAESDREIESLVKQRNEYASTSEEFQHMTDELEKLKHQKTLLMDNNELNRGFNQLVKAASDAQDTLTILINHRDFTKIDPYDNVVTALLRLRDKLKVNLDKLDAGLVSNPWSD